jgi:hypothetical protein
MTEPLKAKAQRRAAATDRGTDGAKPGEEVRTPGDKHAFDADGRAKAREDAPVTIGGEVFHRRRKNWTVTRELRALLRDQEKCGNRAARYRARVDALTEEIRGVRDPDTGAWTKPPMTDDDAIERLEGEIDGFDAEIDAAQGESDEAAYAIIALLLRKADANDRPELEFLKESLDVEEAGDLASALAGGGETDPT